MNEIELRSAVAVPVIAGALLLCTVREIVVAIDRVRLGKDH
jgi:hypothetical protein